MNDLLREQMMTVKEVAEILGVTPEAIKIHIRELFPDIISNGVTTYLSERHVTEIKRKMIPTTQLAGAVTDIEMMERMRSVMEWSAGKIRILQSEVNRMIPLAESAEALTRCDKNICITEAAKHFGLHPKLQVFPYLRARGYLTSKDLPTQDALDAGVLAVRQSKDRGGEFHSQAVVEKSALELWRTVMVPRIIKWSAEQ